MDWDDDEFEPVPVVTSISVQNKWVDEDGADEGIPEAWDEEPPKPSSSTDGVKGSKTTKKEAKKKNPAKSEKEEALKSKLATEQAAAELDPVAEKLKRQLKVEEADFQNTQEIFSGLDSVSVISTADPKDEKDFEALADKLARKLIIYEESYHYRGFLKSLFKLTTQPLKSEEIKELAGALTVIANEKLKSEKTAKKKKGVATKKTTLNLKDDSMERGDDFDAYTDFM